MATIQGRITINEVEVFEVDGDPAAGLGTPGSIGSLAILDSQGVYQKIGVSDTAWARLSLQDKSGFASAGSFSGNPKKSTVTFASAMPDNNYAVHIEGQDARMWVAESKTINGFVINAQASAPIVSIVRWTIIHEGESA